MVLDTVRAAMDSLEIIVAFSINFDKLNEVVHVAYSGIVSLNKRMQAVQEVCDSYRNFMPLKILVNVCDLEMHLSFDEQMSFGRYLASHEGLTNARVAVLYQEGHNPNLVVDTSAFLNGYLLAQFDNMRTAELWLTKS